MSFQELRDPDAQSVYNNFEALEVADRAYQLVCFHGVYICTYMFITHTHTHTHTHTQYIYIYIYIYICTYIHIFMYIHTYIHILI